MDGNVGKALRDARLAQKLTVEEAARATKIRAVRLTDLENGSYDHFPNLAYARGFLLIYARYLGVDLSKYQTIDIGNPARGGAYQYLKNNAESRALRTFAPPKPVNRSRFVIVLVLFSGAITAGVLAALLILRIQQLPSLDQLIQEDRAPLQANAALAIPEATPEATPTPEALTQPEELLSDIEEFMEADTLSLAALAAEDRESSPGPDSAMEVDLWETPVTADTPEEAIHTAAAAAPSPDEGTPETPATEAETTPEPTPKATPTATPTATPKASPSATPRKKRVVANDDEPAPPRAIPVHTPSRTRASSARRSSRETPTPTATPSRRRGSANR